MKEYTALVSANILETEPAEEREEKSGVTYGTVQKVSYYSTTCKLFQYTASGKLL